ncbi:MAG TPA: hypothetical protein VFF30_07425 [Nitrososphaerales archaeon]|nr:hypothetical protein [Nitrososphaerales archaeon]
MLSSAALPLWSILDVYGVSNRHAWMEYVEQLIVDEVQVRFAEWN